MSTTHAQLLGRAQNPLARFPTNLFFRNRLSPGNHNPSGGKG